MLLKHTKEVPYEVSGMEIPVNQCANSEISGALLEDYM